MKASPTHHKYVILRISTCLRQVEGEMNNVCEVVITAITPNESAALPFVIPSAADLQFS
jgi:hypothetical protein